PLCGLCVLCGEILSAGAHDIPNARVDRSIQATVRPGRLEVDYEVSLSELTLAQDLRGLIGSLPGSDRAALFDRYGRETGPLNARGLLVEVDGRPVESRFRGFDLAVEEHPRYTFRLEAELPPRGRLALQDTNYVASEGTSRLALRGRDGVTIRGDDGPEDVRQVAARPAWRLSDAEERRTKQLVVDYEVAAALANAPLHPTVSPGGRGQGEGAAPRGNELPAPGGRLSGLLDRAAGLSLGGLGLFAFVLGAAHAVQPGHGKTLVAAAVVGERGGWPRGVLLALVTTLAHVGVVVAVAALLAATRFVRYESIDVVLVRLAGFAIAAIGLWRLGRHLAGYGEHDAGESPGPGGRGIIGLGLAGGLVPCWDAVILIVVAEMVGRLALGLLLLVAFSLGMAAVLVAVGLVAARVRGLVAAADRGEVWSRRLGIVGGLMLAAIGISLLR
ncbi:MAG TPA: ABC transporter permease, partial [Isosphaeraceae bacterium]